MAHDPRPAADKNAAGPGTALYMRLSVDDETYGDSVSIETQRTILRAYAGEHGFQVYDEYVDDGWSGTNFNRPAFRRMMADAEAGRVNCIITKDLSRLGREHIMTDYYLEFVFPEKRIRYIAVADDEDTARGLSDFVPFKNLFNEWLAKDTSRKVRAAYRAKYAAGEHICTYAPLGYRKDPDRPNRLVPDDETRWIVERIFDLAAGGQSPAAIARTLSREAVPTPSWVHFRRDGGFAALHGAAPGERACRWSGASVRRILENEVYIGCSVQGKKHSISYKNKKMVRTPKDAWIRVENTHEGLVSPALFRQAREGLVPRRRSRKDGTVQIFGGLLHCGGCGQVLSFGENRSASRPIAYYCCSRYRRQAGCTQHYIRRDFLCACVLARLRYQLRLTPEAERRLLSELQQNLSSARSEAAGKRAAALAGAEKRLAELDIALVRLFDSWAAGKLTERCFNALAERYQAEQAALAERTVCLREASPPEPEPRLPDLIRRFTAPEILTAELLNAFVEKIVVHEAEKQPDGTREQAVEIFYRFTDGGRRGGEPCH